MPEKMVTIDEWKEKVVDIVWVCETDEFASKVIAQAGKQGYNYNCKRNDNKWTFNFYVKNSVVPTLILFLEKLK